MRVHVAGQDDTGSPGSDGASPEASPYLRRSFALRSLGRSGVSHLRNLLALVNKSQGGRIEAET
jgi:hypothetical protein